jgi:predicted transcriptional regulator
MRLRDVIRFTNAEVLSGEELLDSIDVEYAYGSDLMSDVLAFARPGSLLLTGLTNVQIMRTAQMLDIPAVVFVRGKRPQDAAISLAYQVKIPVILSRLSMFENCGILYREGLLPCSIPDREV